MTVWTEDGQEVLLHLPVEASGGRVVRCSFQMWEGSTTTIFEVPLTFCVLRTSAISSVPQNNFAKSSTPP